MNYKAAKATQHKAMRTLFIHELMPLLLVSCVSTYNSTAHSTARHNPAPLVMQVVQQHRVPPKAEVSFCWLSNLQVT
jgi:hypothetical protein